MQNGLKNIFSRKNKNFGSNGKILRKISIFYENIVLNGYPYKNVTKYFCIFFHFRTLHLFLFFLKKTSMKPARGFAPPPGPVTDWSVTYRFFLRLPWERVSYSLQRTVRVSILYIPSHYTHCTLLIHFCKVLRETTQIHYFNFVQSGYLCTSSHPTSLDSQGCQQKGNAQFLFFTTFFLL